MKTNYIQNLPSVFLKITREVGRFADQKNQAVYLVGGVVRDLILKRDIKDLDFVVEGDAIAFAQAIALKRNVNITVYRQFGTATVFLNKDLEIDFVSARKELYVNPGALPKVEMAGLSEDLFRREFTINTLCLSANQKSWGHLIDLYGGFKDLKSKMIRILHEKSFVDDPTRILRAVRFASRLHFKIDGPSWRLIKQAVRQKVLDRVKQPRLFQELKKNLSEPDSKSQLQILQQLNVLSAIHQRLKVDDTKLKAIEMYGKKSRESQWLFILMSLVSRLKHEELVKFLEQIQLNKIDQKSVSQSLQSNQILAWLNKHLIKRSEVYMILHHFQWEAIKYFHLCAQTARQKKRIQQYLDHDRFCQVLTSGDELKRVGYSQGQQIKEILLILLSQRIDGLIKSKSDELQLAQKYLKECKDESNG